jgi:hypothetical protein
VPSLKIEIKATGDAIAPTILVVVGGNSSTTPGDLCGLGRSCHILANAEQISQPKLTGRANEASLEGRFAVIIVNHLLADPVMTQMSR